VTDLLKLEYDLDNVVLGGAKISVNLSRFQRSEGGDEESVRKGRSRSKRQHRSARLQHRSRSKSIAWNQRSFSHGPRENRLSSYAQAVRTGAGLKRGPHQQKLCLSYEVENNAMDNYVKAFVGVAANPAMTYNIKKNVQKYTKMMYTFENIRLINFLMAYYAITQSGNCPQVCNYFVSLYNFANL
jgi:hypothetical protein